MATGRNKRKLMFFDGVTYFICDIRSELSNLSHVATAKASLLN